MNCRARKALAEQDAPPILQGRSLSKHFITPGGETIEVLRSFSFELYSGEIVALIGPSGCGKSTLFDVISGVTVPDAGVMLRMGSRFDPRNTVGFMNYMFQEDRLLPWKTARENIELALYPLGKATKERRDVSQKMLDIVGLPTVGDHYPNQLSGGMRSRIALARAFATSPKVLLMDEPFSKLDALTRERIHEQLLSLRDSLRFGCFFITHDVLEALALADRIIVASANPMQIAKQYDLKQQSSIYRETLAASIRSHLHEE